MCVNERQDTGSGTVKMQGEEVEKVDDFKYLRGRPKSRFMDVVKEDMAEVEVTEEDSVDRNNRRRKIRCGDP